MHQIKATIPDFSFDLQVLKSREYNKVLDALETVYPGVTFDGNVRWGTPSIYSDSGVDIMIRRGHIQHRFTFMYTPHTLTIAHTIKNQYGIVPLSEQDYELFLQFMDKLQGMFPVFQVNEYSHNDAEGQKNIISYKQKPVSQFY